MAKRKKKRGKKSGGAFGRPKNKRASPAAEDDEYLISLRKELRIEKRINEIIETEMAAQDFKSDQESGKYFEEHFADLSAEDAIAKYGRYEDSPAGRCQKILDEAEMVTSGVSAYRKKVREALEADPDSVNALLLLAKSADDMTSEFEAIETAVAKGREIYADLITEAKDGIPEEEGLGAFARAHPFLHALKELGILWETTRGDFRKAIEVYREMLALNPSDLFRVTEDIVRLLLLLGDLESAEEMCRDIEVLDSCGMCFNVLFLQFTNAWLKATQKGWKPDPDYPNLSDAPDDTFESVEMILAKTIECFPWAPALLADIRCAELLGSEFNLPGTPGDVLEEARKAVSLWTIGNPIAGLWMITRSMDYLDDVNLEQLEQNKAQFSNIFRQLKKIKIRPEHFDDPGLYRANKLLVKMSGGIQSALMSMS